jgi:Ras and EF-hand domain-containing protein
MYDVTCEQSFLNVREWIQTITDITDRTIPIIIIGNKTDLRDSYARNGTRVIDYQEGLKFAKVRKIYFLN